MIRSFKQLLGKTHKTRVLKAQKFHPQQVSKNAQTVITTLQAAGFKAYLVGGGVRDLWLGLQPKDFDVATNATPEQIKPLFKRCIIIGRRFRLAHIYFHKDIIEVATFRAEQTQATSDVSAQGMLLRDNTYTENLKEDALRRDFTVNALYYDLKQTIDPINGLRDLKKGLIRMIGEPHVRYKEDPVRMLRAVRLASKCGFRIENQTAQAIHSHRNLLEHIPPGRYFEEYTKLFLKGHAVDVFEQLKQYNLFQYLFPYTEQYLNEPDNNVQRQLILIALNNTDQRLAEGKTITPAFLLAVFLWYPLCDKMNQYLQEKLPFGDAIHAAMHETLKQQIQHTSIPKRFTQGIKDIWAMQWRLEARRPRGFMPLMHHPRFRAAYDFLLLRAAAGENVNQADSWWTSFISATEPQQKKMLQALSKQPKKRRKERQ